MSRPIPHCTFCEHRAAYADLARVDRDLPPVWRCRDEEACDARMRAQGRTTLSEVRGRVSAEALVKWLSGAVRVG